jgi:predicted RND superfamily exporter protein
MTERFKSWFTHHLLQNPKRYFLFVIFLCLIAIPGILKIRSDFSYKMWYNDQDPLMLSYVEFEKKFGNDDTGIIAIYNPQGIFNRDTLKIIQELTGQMWKVNDIIRVDSLANFESIKSENDQIEVLPYLNDNIDEMSDSDIDKLKDKIKNDKNILGWLVNKDLTVTFITGQLRPAFDKVPSYHQIHLDIEKLIKKYDGHPDIKFMQTGTVSITYALTDITFSDMKILLPLLLIMFSLVLYFIYRNALGIFIPFTIIGITVWQMYGIMGYLGHKFNAISSASPTILTTVCLADVIHLLTSFYLARKHGNSTYYSLEYSIKKNLYPTFITTITTFLGFLGFANTKVIPIGNMGIEVAAGVMLAYLNTYFFIVPFFLWLSRKEDQSIRGIDMNIVDENEEKLTITPFTKKTIAFLIKHAWTITISTIILTLVCFYYSSKLTVNMDPIEQFPDDYFLTKNIKFLEKTVGGYTGVEFSVSAGEVDGINNPDFLKRVERFENWLLEQPYIFKTISIIGILKRLNQTLHNDDPKYYIIPDSQEEVSQELLFYTMSLPPGRELNNRMTLQGDHIRLTALWNIHSSRLANQYIHEMNLKAKEFGLDAYITGKMPLFHDLTPYVVNTFVSSFGFSLITIALTLMVILSSVKLGFLAMIPNVFPVVLGTAIYQLMGRELDMATVIVTSISLGIAVDDSTHFLFDFRRLRKQGLSIKHTLEHIMTYSYPALLFTTVVNSAGFGIFFLGDYVPNAKFGVMIAFILIFALIADFFIMPAILYLSEKNKKN